MQITREKIKSFLSKFQPAYHLVETIYLKINVLRARLFGTKIEEQRWATKEQNEILTYWDDRNNPRRNFLVERIEKFSPVSSILEVGCICGPNLYLLTKRFKNAKLIGVDINSLAIKLGNDLFQKEGLANVRLILKKADELSEFADKEFDVVLTDACLIYIGPDKIRKVLADIARIAKKGIVMAEWNIPEGKQEIYEPHIGVWRRNYRYLLEELFLKEKISIIKTPAEFWPDTNWQRFGYIIEAKTKI